MLEDLVSSEGMISGSYMAVSRCFLTRWKGCYGVLLESLLPKGTNHIHDGTLQVLISSQQPNLLTSAPWGSGFQQMIVFGITVVFVHFCLVLLMSGNLCLFKTYM